MHLGAPGRCLASRTLISLPAAMKPLTRENAINLHIEKGLQVLRNSRSIGCTVNGVQDSEDAVIPWYRHWSSLVMHHMKRICWVQIASRSCDRHGSLLSVEQVYVWQGNASCSENGQEPEKPVGESYSATKLLNKDQSPHESIRHMMCFENHVRF